MKQAMKRDQWKEFVRMSVFIRQRMGLETGIKELKEIEQILADDIIESFSHGILIGKQILYLTEAIREIRWELLQQVQAERGGEGK